MKQREARAANLEHYRKRDRLYFQRNRIKKLLNGAAWRAKNHSKLSSMRRQRYATEYAISLMQIHAHRAQKKGIPGIFTPEEQTFCKQYFGYACAVCGREEGFDLTLAFDHWIPLSHPQCPGNDVYNIVVLCHGKTGCNNSKGNRQADMWLQERFGPRKATRLLKKIETYFEVVRKRHRGASLLVE